jgi:ligand-binding sensor domain-containing protein
VLLRGDDVTVWNEGNQLESELLSAIAVSPGGVVYVATPDGVGTYDGERWRFPGELRFAVNDLVLARDGRLWMATERGIAIFDGKKVRRMDVRRGLVENQVLDVTVDEFGRVWARGPKSLIMVTP